MNVDSPTETNQVIVVTPSPPEYSAADGEVRGQLDRDGRHGEHDPQAQEDPRLVEKTEISRDKPIKNT